MEQSKCVLQSVVGGWGDEKASTSKGSGMSLNEAQLRKERTAQLQQQLPGQTQLHEGNNGPNRKAKRPQLKRLQHDDPFDGADMLALDDVRPEEIPVQ